MTEQVDLGLKIVSKEEALFTELKERTNRSIESIKKELIVQEAVLEMCEQKLQKIALENDSTT